MNITPIEIRQKEFERHFRGYDKDEVNAFLHTLSQAWERMLQENREKSIKLAQAEKDIEKVREVEGSLFRTLRTAEDTSSDIITKAERGAEETRQAAERHQQEILQDAHTRANSIVNDAQTKAETIIRGIRERVEQIKQEAEDAENRRQYALSQLEELAHRVIQQVENAQPLSVSDAVEESERLLAEVEESTYARIEKHTGEEEDARFTDSDYNRSEPAYAAEATDESESQETSEHDSEEESLQEPEMKEESEEAYEPAWVSEDNEPSPAPEPTPARLKRGSFFDEID